MRVFAVDDEQLLLRQLVKTIIKCMPDADICAFSTPDEALSALDGEAVDIAFLDIELGHISGVELAKKIKVVFPFCNIVFCTGYSTFTMQAFDLGASDYLMKPITEEKMMHALSQLRYTTELKAPEGKLFVRCFGEFEVFRDGAALTSLTKKAKELFAYLIDKVGAMSSSTEIIRTLFFDSADSYYRVAKMNLEKALGEAGAGDVLIKEWGKLGIDRRKVFCDYYEYLTGNPSTVNLYKGTYMSQYAWAKHTLKKLNDR